MHVFPFTADEWNRVNELSTSLTNAALANDDALRASYFIDFVELLDKLRSNHGEHPVLLETEADFEDDLARAMELYDRAIQLAVANRLPTLSIRISLVDRLIDHFGDFVRAKRELEACRGEVEASEDDYERQRWRELLDKCLDDEEQTLMGRENGC